MNVSQKLAVTIPTCNRADLLDECLGLNVPFAMAHSIPIYISDNASSDNTKSVVEKWMTLYPLINYHRNVENIGPDANFEMALKLPEANYVWLLGDSYQLPSMGLEYLLSMLDNKNSYDVIVFNLINTIGIPTKDYVNQSELLADLSGLMSCLSCLVYSHSLIETANFSRFYNSNYIQTGIIFEALSYKPSLVHWCQNLSVQLIPHAGKVKKSWRDTPGALEIGVQRWVNFIFSLPPSYLLESKLKAAKSFGVASSLLKFKGLLSMRAEGVLTISRLLKYRKSFLISTSVGKFILALGITLIPIFLLRILKTKVKAKLVR